MTRCDHDTCPRPNEPVPDYPVTNAHVFSGYGYILHFHPECCPGTVEGEPCTAGHDGPRVTMMTDGGGGFCATVEPRPRRDHTHAATTQWNDRAEACLRQRCACGATRASAHETGHWTAWSPDNPPRDQ